MKTTTIAPVAGRIIRDPLTRLTITTNKIVPLNDFWVRRIKDGDVQEVKPTASSKKQTLETKGA